MKAQSLATRQTRRATILTAVFLSLLLWLVWPHSSAARRWHVTPHTVAPLSTSDVQRTTHAQELDVPHLDPNRVIHIGGLAEENDASSAAAVAATQGSTTHPVVEIVMSAAMSNAWKASSKRLTFPTRITIAGGGSDAAALPAHATFYGKSSLKLKYTSRRSVHVSFSRPVRLAADGPEMSNVLLLSLWEDKHRLAYRSSIELLRALGLFHAFATMVELRCSALHTGERDDDNYCSGGRTLGAYLLLEYPSDAIARHTAESLRSAAQGAPPSQRVCEPTDHYKQRVALLHAIAASSTAEGGGVEVGTRNWFYYEKPKKYDILHVPSYQRNSTLSGAYAAFESDPLGRRIPLVSKETFRSETFVDLNQYLTWIAVNSLLMNGDYDDEVFFYRMGPSNAASLLSVMAWDYDTVFAPCHRKGFVTSRIMYCAETPIEHKIASSAALQKEYREVLRCVLNTAGTLSNWTSIVNQVALREVLSVFASPAALRATFDEGKTRDDVVAGGKDLVERFAERHAALLSSLPVESGMKVAPLATARREAAAFERDGSPGLCAEGSLRRALAPHLKKLLPREHKAGRGSVSVRGMPIAEATLLLPLGQHSSSVRYLRLGESNTELHESGLYCARISANCSSSTGAANSVSIDYPFVLRGKERGSAEFALPTYVKPAPLDAVVDWEAAVDSAKVLVVAPRRWVISDWFPAVLRLVVVKNDSTEWVRKNVVIGAGGGGSSVLVRGYSAVKFSGRGSWSDSVDGPLLPWAPSDTVVPLSVGFGATARRGDGLQASVQAPLIVSNLASVEPLTSFEGLNQVMGDDCTVVLEGSMELAAGTSFSIGAGCVVVLKVGAKLRVHGTLRVEGSATHPVVITGSGDDDQQWVSIVADGPGASVIMSYAFVVGSGVKGRLEPNTGKHHKHSAALTVVNGASLSLSHTYVITSLGPAIAAGTRASISMDHCLVQWAELGVECVDCSFKSTSSVWSHFPTWDAAYEDNDNDALYLSGGAHRIEHSVVAHAKDDCLDSGTPEKSHGDGGSLLVDNTIFEYCQHEAIALSSSPRSSRTARITRVAIQHSQQGVESGYTGTKHFAEIHNSAISNTLVAVRFGDNYYNRPQAGQLRATGLVLWNNSVNALNYVRELGGPQFTSAFKITDSKVALDARTAAMQNTGAGAGDGGMCESVYSAVKPSSPLYSGSVVEQESVLANVRG